MALPICWCRATPRHSIHVLAELQLLVRHGRKRGLRPMTGKMWRVELLIGRRDIPKCEGSNPCGYKGQESGCINYIIYMFVYIHTCAYNISDQCVWYTKYILVLYLQTSVCTCYIYIIYIMLYHVHIYIYMTYIHTHIYTHIYMHIYFVAGCWHFDCLVLVQNYYHDGRSMQIHGYFPGVIVVMESKGTEIPPPTIGGLRSP